MDFFNVKRFRKIRKSKCEEEADQEKNPLPDESKDEIATDSVGKTVAEEEEADDEDDDDDFITNEVKRRLKELRKNSFMGEIPEETCPEEEEEEEGETRSSEWRESEVEDMYTWCGFDTLYNKYCERMLLFDKMSAQQLKETGIIFLRNRFSNVLRYSTYFLYNLW